MLIAIFTILYGNLCAIPQRNVKRLLAYSSIAHAGYLLMGVTAMSRQGAAAVLFYFGAYLLGVIASFSVVGAVRGSGGSSDFSAFAGLGRRSPFLALTLTLALVSLAGIPPLAGFFGKFLLFQALVEQAVIYPPLFAVIAVAIVGVVVSIYYYFGLIRVMYWGFGDTDEEAPISLSRPLWGALAFCCAGMLFLGVYPAPLVEAADHAVRMIP